MIEFNPTLAIKFNPDDNPAEDLLAGIYRFDVRDENGVIKRFRVVYQGLNISTAYNRFANEYWDGFHNVSH